MNSLVVKMTVAAWPSLLCFGSNHGINIISQSQAIKMIVVKCCVSLGDQPFKVVAFATEIDQDLERYTAVPGIIWRGR